MIEDTQNSIGAQSSKRQNLKLIYDYYCKLNDRIQHKYFADVNTKALKMRLHQFMTFCKDFNILPAIKKKDSFSNSLPTIKPILQNSSIIRGKNSILRITSKQKISLKPHPFVRYVRQLMINTEGSDNQVGSNSWKEYSTIIQNQKNQKNDANTNFQEKKLADMFKKYVDHQGGILFQQFEKIIKTLSSLIFQNKSSSMNKLMQTTFDKIDNKQQSMNYVKINDQSLCILEMLKYLGISTKEDTLSTFQRINEHHQTFDHLALIRTPITKLQLKNNPCHKINEICKKREIVRPKFSKRQKLIQYSDGRLKKVVNIETKKNQNTTLKYSYLDHYLQNHFVKKNIPIKYRITSLNKKQEGSKTSRMAQQAVNRKYSERHKDNIIRRIVNGQIFDLIDVTNLYDDQLFNKYLQLNYVGEVQKTQPVQARKKIDYNKLYQ